MRSISAVIQSVNGPGSARLLTWASGPSEPTQIPKPWVARLARLDWISAIGGDDQRHADRHRQRQEDRHECQAHPVAAVVREAGCYQRAADADQQDAGERDQERTALSPDEGAQHVADPLARRPLRLQPPLEHGECGLRVRARGEQVAEVRAELGRDLGEAAEAAGVAAVLGGGDEDGADGAR